MSAERTPWTQQLRDQSETVGDWLTGPVGGVAAVLSGIALVGFLLIKVISSFIG